MRNHTSFMLNVAAKEFVAMTKLQSYLSFALLCAVSLVIGRHPLASTFSLALHNDEYTHLLLILPVSASLILLGWRSQKPAAQANFRIGPALLFAAILVSVFARWIPAGLADVQLSVSMLALVLWWKRGRLTWRDIVPLLPFVALGAGLAWNTAHMEVH